MNSSILHSPISFSRPLAVPADLSFHFDHDRWLRSRIEREQADGDGTTEAIELGRGVAISRFCDRSSQQIDHDSIIRLDLGARIESDPFSLSISPDAYNAEIARLALVDDKRETERMDALRSTSAPRRHVPRIAPAPEPFIDVVYRNFGSLIAGGVLVAVSLILHHALSKL